VTSVPELTFTHVPVCAPPASNRCYGNCATSTRPATAGTRTPRSPAVPTTSSPNRTAVCSGRPGVHRAAAAVRETTPRGPPPVTGGAVTKSEINPPGLPKTSSQPSAGPPARPPTAEEHPTMSGIPLGVLDLVPIPSGSTAAEALHHTIDLARQTERFGYSRYWFAEHHLNPGVAGTSPADLHDQDRLRGRTTRPPHGPVHRRGVRPDRCPAPRATRPGPRPLRRTSPGTVSGTPPDHHPRRRRAHPQRPEDPAPVLARPPAGLTTPQAPAATAAATGCPSPGLR
jgi:hypothetical protein